ncbi:protein FAM227A-like [Sarcophilus harrisii]
MDVRPGGPPAMGPHLSAPGRPWAGGGAPPRFGNGTRRPPFTTAPRFTAIWPSAASFPPFSGARACGLGELSLRWAGAQPRPLRLPPRRLRHERHGIEDAAPHRNAGGHQLQRHPYGPAGRFPVDFVLGEAEAARGTEGFVKQNPPLCFVGSVSKLNKKIAQIDLRTRLHKTSIHSKILVIEKLEAEEEMREQQRLWGEKEKASKTKTKIHKFFPLTSSPSGVPYLGSKKRIQKDGLVELYRAPAHNEEMPNELPNRVNYFEMVGNIVRAQGNTTISGKAICAPAEMTKFFCCPYTKSIVLDCFWWIFHERYDVREEGGRLEVRRKGSKTIPGTMSLGCLWGLGCGHFCP